MTLINVKLLAWLSFITLSVGTWIHQRGDLHVQEDDGHTHTLAWLIKFQHDNFNKSFVDTIAKSVGLVNLGQVLWLKDHYFFVHPAYKSYQKILNIESKLNLYKAMKSDVENKLATNEFISRYHVESFRPRSKRSYKFHDPNLSKEWYLRKNQLNISGVWEYNITGKGVTVCIVDDGVEWMNPDLKDSYNAEASYDIISNDENPNPDYNNSESGHGTRCAGEIVAAPNDFCGVGLAFGSQFSAIRILDDAVTDSMEAKAFSYRTDINDIFSCSWGPMDDGMTIEGPMYLTEQAIKNGVDIGRKGYGVIYVVASGNGRAHGDNCNYDGFSTSPHTITIGALGQNDKIASFSEACASVNAVTYGLGFTNDIVTTDIMAHKDSKYFKSNSGCTFDHKGTSAAAPLASAMISLMLEVNPCLTWRDIQYLIMLTSEKVNIMDQNSQWVTNAVGISHSLLYGFGKLNAWYLVNSAKVWDSVPWSTTFTSSDVIVDKSIPPILQLLNSSVYVDDDDLSRYGLHVIEKVQVSITLSYPDRGRLQIILISPSNTQSIVAERRLKDSSTSGLNGWKFTSLQFWGEKPSGKWTLVISSNGKIEAGVLKSWYLILHGTPMLPSEFQRRKLFVEKSKHYNHISEDKVSKCHPSQKSFVTGVDFSNRLLRILVITSIGIFILGFWEVLDSAIFKENEEKSTLKSSSDEVPEEEVKLID